MTLVQIVQAILWPWVAFSAVAFLYSGFKLWLSRDAQSVKELKRELAETQSDWTHKYEAQEEKYDRRISAIERAINAANRGEGKNPLGSHYSTRGGS